MKKLLVYILFVHYLISFSTTPQCRCAYHCPVDGQSKAQLVVTLFMTDFKINLILFLQCQGLNQPINDILNVVHLN